MKYYIADSSQPKGFIEVTEGEWNEFLQFRAEVNSYAEQVTKRSRSNPARPSLKSEFLNNSQKN